MTPHLGNAEQVVQAVMADGRRLRRVNDVVRARLLARARAASKEKPVPSVADLFAFPQPRRRLAFAAAALLAFSAAGAAAALHSRASSHSPAAPASPVRARPAPAPGAAPGPLSSTEPIAEPAYESPAEHARRSVSPQESYAAELSLLQRAHSRYNARAFSAALALLAEHAHRFPHGRLAEEREAFRVRSLEAAGREPEARRALDEFGRRFPRSALLSRLRNPDHQDHQDHQDP